MMRNSAPGASAGASKIWPVITSLPADCPLKENLYWEAVAENPGAGTVEKSFAVFTLILQPG